MFRTSTYVVITLPTTVAIVWSRPTACVNPRELARRRAGRNRDQRPSADLGDVVRKEAAPPH
jgi:hypothetical protein